MLESILFMIGLPLIFIAWIWSIIAGFHISIFTGVLNVVFWPIPLVIYGFEGKQGFKKPFLVLLGGFGALILALTMVFI